MADEKKRLLAIKARLKKRQPVFIRQDAHKHKRVKQVWRSPKGLHSKMRDSRKGYRIKLQEGYHTPLAVRGLDKHGLRLTRVATMLELAALDAKVHSIILAGGLGGRKKLAIIEEAKKKSFIIQNAKADAVETIKARLNTQHEAKKARVSEKSSKQKSLEEKATKEAVKADEKDATKTAAEPKPSAKKSDK